MTILLAHIITALAIASTVKIITNDKHISDDELDKIQYKECRVIHDLCKDYRKQK